MTYVLSFCSTFRKTIDHLFFYCAHSGAFWYDFESYWFTLTKEQRKLDLKTILIGDTDTQCPLFNYLIVLGKLHLWNCRRNNRIPSFPSFKELVKQRYRRGALGSISNRKTGRKILQNRKTAMNFY